MNNNNINEKRKFIINLLAIIIGSIFTILPVILSLSGNDNDDMLGAIAGGGFFLILFGILSGNNMIRL